VRLRAAEGKGVDLTHARVSGQGVDLHAVRLANLKAVDTNFTQATLTAAHLEGAKLERAHFQQTRLQAAHLEGADLRGAQFQQADLRDTYFTHLGAKKTQLDDDALRSIIGALHRDDAHFAPEHKQRLDELVAEREERRTRPGTSSSDEKPSSDETDPTDV